MKRHLCLLLMGLLCMVARAVPADPTPIVVTQPDGSTLTVVLHGDEFFHRGEGGVHGLCQFFVFLVEQVGQGRRQRLLALEIMIEGTLRRA